MAKFLFPLHNSSLYLDLDLRGLVLYFDVKKKKHFVFFVFSFFFCELNIDFDDRIDCCWMRTIVYKL